jgi:hypothetical protein
LKITINRSEGFLDSYRDSYSRYLSYEFEKALNFANDYMNFISLIGLKIVIVLSFGSQEILVFLDVEANAIALCT